MSPDSSRAATTSPTPRSRSAPTSAAESARPFLKTRPGSVTAWTKTAPSAAPTATFPNRIRDLSRPPRDRRAGPHMASRGRRSTVGRGMAGLPRGVFAERSRNTAPKLCSPPRNSRPVVDGPVYKGSMSKPSTTPATAAISAHGPARLLGPLLLLTLAALPATWWLPLFVARVPFLWREQVTVVSGLAALWDLRPPPVRDRLLRSVVAPITKLVATLHVWYRAPLGTAAKALGRLALLGKLSMAELFLLAVVIVGFRAWASAGSRSPGASRRSRPSSSSPSPSRSGPRRRSGGSPGSRMPASSGQLGSARPRRLGRREARAGRARCPPAGAPSGSGGRRSASVTWASTETAISPGSRRRSASPRARECAPGPPRQHPAPAACPGASRGCAWSRGPPM